MTGYVGPIDSMTLENGYFRRVLFTGTHTQLVVMCLEPGEDIGKERHVAQGDQCVDDDAVEALYALRSAEPLGRDGAQDQGRGRPSGGPDTMTRQE